MVGQILFWGTVFVLGVWSLGGILWCLVGLIFPGAREEKYKWLFYVIAFFIILVVYCIRL